MDKYFEFIEVLNQAKEKGLIDILYRGESKKFAFKNLNLDTKYNSIDKFAERLFFFGDKAKYFWNQTIAEDTFSEEFEINEISVNMFKYIFSQLNNLIGNANKPATKEYFENNQEVISFFKDSHNINTFLLEVEKLSNEKKTFYRNYYLEIIHQLGETEYSKNSLLISSSKKRSIAKQFAKNNIIINFWNLKLSKNKAYLVDSMQNFEGKPYENQKEVSVFSAIFPHYIYSFEYAGSIYVNPNLKDCKDLNSLIYTGFEINQENFIERLKKESRYERGVSTDGESFKLII